MSYAFSFRTLALILSLETFLTGCNPDSYRTYVKAEELKMLENEPKASKPRQVAGVDLWAAGMPNRKYRILGVIHDVRRNIAWRLQSYDQDLAKSIKRAGGDGGIILMADSKVVDHLATNCSSFAPNNQECGDFSGALQRSDSSLEEVTVYSQNRESTNVPLEYKDSHVLVIKYED